MVSVVWGAGLGAARGLVWELVYALINWLYPAVEGLGLVDGLFLVLGLALVLMLPTGGAFKRSAVSSRLILVWPSTKRQLIDFLRRAGRGLEFGLKLALVFGLGWGLARALTGRLPGELAKGLFFLAPIQGLFWGLIIALFLAPVVGLTLALVFGLLQTRSVLITSRTPKEARSRSLIAALTWLVGGLVAGLPFGMAGGPVLGLGLALRNGGWFVVLQKVAQRRLARAGNLPPNPYDVLEWGVERQIFRRVGGGIRFRHGLIQQHLANTSAGAS